MGIVYHATDPSIGRPVAIKTIRIDEFADAGERSRLRDRLFREARSAGILAHPGIVTIYDMDEREGLAYIAMQYVNGPTLEQMMDSGDAVPPQRLLDILRQTAAALDYAHQKGIVHRDIKPANIMVDEGGIVRITDFGIAKVTASEQMTQAGFILGTPSYMSPEQVQGSTIDGRADQYSLAIVAYELLTGEKPFAGESVTTLVFKIVYEQPAPVIRLNPTLSEGIDQALHKALSKKPEQRYLTCSAFVDDLDAACSQTAGWCPIARGATSSLPTVIEPARAVEAPVIESPPSIEQSLDAADTSVHATKKKRRVVPVLAGFLLLGALAAAGWYGWTQYETSTVERTVVEPPRAPSAKVDAPKLETPVSLPPAPKDSPKPAPPQPQPIAVSSDPTGAFATVDGDVDKGCQTPCSVLASPGRHTVSVRIEGFQSEQREVFVGKEPVQLPLVRLLKRAGTVMLTTTPAGATVYVNDGKRSEITPAQLRLPPGKHTITVEKDGVKKSEEVEIRDGSTRYLSITINQ